MGIDDISADPSSKNIPRLEQQNAGITLTWADNFSSFFHYVWLRDCCYCKICGDSYSSSRFLHPSDVALDITPESITVDDSNVLHISWKQDKHQSRYDLQWVRQHSYSDESRIKRFHRPVLWDAKITGSLPEVYYNNVADDLNQRMELFRKLRDFGFVVVRNGPNEEKGLEQVANLIGEIGESAYGKFFDLSPQSKPRTLGNTMSPVPPHTDEAYRHNPPGINVLHCIRAAESDGESVLVDGFNLGELLNKSDPEGFRLLTRQPQPYHRVVHGDNIDQRTRAPVFVVDEMDTIVGFRFHTRTAAPLDVSLDLFSRVYEANHKLSKLMLDENNQACFRLESGDTLMFDNHRVMHARKGFKDQNRKLKICNVSRESFHEQLRIMAFNLGYIEESQQILSSGVTG